MTGLLIALLLATVAGALFGYRSRGITLTYPWTGFLRSDLSPHPEGAKLFVEFNAGRWVRPVPKLRYWFDSDNNPWFRNDPRKHWFTLDIPFAGPLIGFDWDGDGKYLGWKRFPLAHEEYRAWFAGPIGEGYSAIVLSVRG
jgi:hypothetical protein